MSHTLAELNELAQGIANKLGHISQERLLEIEALINKKECSTAPCPDQQPVSDATETPAV